MNIIHVNPFYHPFVGGTEKFLYDLNHRLAKRHDVTVLTARLPCTKAREEVDGVRVIRVPSIVLEKLPPPLPPPYAAPFCFSYHFAKACAEFKPDVVHFHNRFFPSFAKPVLLKRLCRGAARFFTIHNARTVGIDATTDFLGQLYDNFAGNLFLRNADFIMGNSKWSLKVTKPPNYPNAQTAVVYNGVDTKKYEPASAKVQKKIRDELGCDKYSITVCRLVPQKGVEFLVRGVSDFVKNARVKPDEYKAVICNRGPEKPRLERLAHELGISKHVVFTGVVPEQKLPAFFSGAECSVLPSLYEPFGIVLAESMACGTPCVATSVGGIPEVVANTGLLIPPAKPDKISQALDCFVNKGFKKKLSRRARQRAVKRFDWNVIAKQVEKHYEQQAKK